MISELYPLKFTPILKEKIWGGKKLSEILKKNVGSMEKVGESWEISGVDGNVSVVSEGPLKSRTLTGLLAQYRSELVGKKIYEEFGNTFPLLIKFIDANDDLSVQVHPDNTMATEKHHSNGKTEMWYILQADEHAKLIAGFSQPMHKVLFLSHVKNNSLMEVLNQEPAERDDYFFMPAGRIHTIGKGILLAEIQQSSDVTYRICDYDRKDDSGSPRALHVVDAAEALDYVYYDDYKQSYKGEINSVTPIVDCPFFSTHVLNYNESVTQEFAEDSFHIVIGIEGRAKLTTGNTETWLGPGESVLIPASITEVTIVPEDQVKFLETFIRL